MLSKYLLILTLFIGSIASAQSTIVYFDYSKSSLTSDTKKTLDKFIAAGNINSLGIFGHTDQMGGDEYNEWLSVQRAIEVKNYLTSKGVSADDISVVMGFGAANLVSKLNDDMARQLNRRVVLTNNYKATDADKDMAARQATLQKPEKQTASVQSNNNAVATETEASPFTTITKEAPVVKQQQSEKLVEDIKDSRTKAGENIVLKNINFYEGSHEFLARAKDALNDLLETMQQIPTLEIEIQGHVCCQEGDADALDVATGDTLLSVNRAKAVYDYLVSNGINKSRLSYKGLAHKFPLVPMEITEADKVANRRVEIKIVKK